MSTILFLSLTACALSWPPAEMKRDPIALEAVPCAARKTLEEESKGRPLRDVVKVTNADGTVNYEARFHKPWSFTYSMAVESNGQLIGRWSTEINGSGP